MTGINIRHISYPRPAPTSSQNIRIADALLEQNAHRLAGSGEQTVTHRANQSLPRNLLIQLSLSIHRDIYVSRHVSLKSTSPPSLIGVGA